PVGEPQDFCYKLSDQGVLTDDLQSTLYALGLLTPSGGQDNREDHYQATLLTTIDPRMGWRPILDSKDPLSERIRAEREAQKYSVFSGVQNYFNKLFGTPNDNWDDTGDMFDDTQFNPNNEVAARVMVV